MDDGPGLEKDGQDDKICYGIRTIVLSTNVFPVKLEDCD